MESCYISEGDLAELEHYGNLKEAHLRWLNDFPVKEALPILKRCTTLHRLTLKKWILDTVFPPSKEFCEFIMELKQLTFMHMIYNDYFDCNHSKSFVEKVQGFILPRRPNFEFYQSCCGKCESRVPGECFYY